VVALGLLLSIPETLGTLPKMGDAPGL
jgi:hypothetical protein